MKNKEYNIILGTDELNENNIIIDNKNGNIQINEKIINSDKDEKQILQVEEKIKINNLEIQECQNIEDIQSKQEK